MMIMQQQQQQQMRMAAVPARANAAIGAPRTSTVRARRCRRVAVVVAAAGNNKAAAATATATAAAAAAAAAALVLSAACPQAAWAVRPEGVSRPELLPKGPEVASVIDVAGFLAPSEEARLAKTIERLERDTGYRLRVLAQAFPETPGLAIRDYWAVDDRTIVFVADPTFGDMLNFNVGGSVDLDVPRNFWSRLASKFGNKFFLRDNGEAVAITDAVGAIDACLREPNGRAKCSAIVDVSDGGGGGGGMF